MKLIDDPFVLVSLQSPFSDVTLSVIGDGAGASFFDVNDQGQVKLKTNVNLTTDNGLEYFVSQLLCFSLFSSLCIIFRSSNYGRVLHARLHSV